MKDCIYKIKRYLNSSFPIKIEKKISESLDRRICYVRIPFFVIPFENFQLQSCLHQEKVNMIDIYLFFVNLKSQKLNYDARPAASKLPELLSSLSFV